MLAKVNSLARLRLQRRVWRSVNHAVKLLSRRVCTVEGAGWGASRR